MPKVGELSADPISRRLPKTDERADRGDGGRCSEQGFAKFSSIHVREHIHVTGPRKPQFATVDCAMQNRGRASLDVSQARLGQTARYGATCRNRSQASLY